MTIDPLAYEIRRLSDVLLAATEAEAPPKSPPGELALSLAATFDLRPIDVDVALAVLAAEIDHDFSTLLSASHGRTELAVLAALLPRLEDRLAFADAIGPESPIVRRRFVHRSIENNVGVFTATRRFRRTVFGTHLLASLPAFASRAAKAHAIASWASCPPGLLDAMKRLPSGALCVVTGGPGVGKSTWSVSAAHTVGDSCLRISAAHAARVGGNVASEIRELIEDAALARWPVVLDDAEELLRGETRLSRLLEDCLDTTSAKIFVVVANSDDIHDRLASRALGEVHIDAPPPDVRRQLWNAADAPEATKNTLAHDIVLTPRQIANAAALIAGGMSPTDAAFTQLPRRNNLTLPDRATARLEALVLPAEVREEIVELIGAIRSRGDAAKKIPSARGRGITALFDGDSGTGKTFACEVIASEVGLPLMRVNVASLVDKYIGETEKNLARVFAQAQAQGGILFFDEADALFGNRTDVSRAQDRYANLETNLLLQLMEQFNGVVLLTTNLKRNINQAFMRRIMFKVYFDTPEAEERARLWASILPADSYDADVSFPRLAKNYELAGGSVRAATLRAAYRAAAAGRKITMSDLVDCAQLETQGMGRVATSMGGLR